MSNLKTENQNEHRMKNRPGGILPTMIFCIFGIVSIVAGMYFESNTLFILSLVLVFVALLSHISSNMRTADFVEKYSRSNTLEASEAIQAIQEHEYDKDPYHELVFNKVFQDLENFAFVREFCAAIQGNKDIESTYTGRFMRQAQGNAFRAMKKRCLVDSKTGAFNESCAKDFLEALETAFAATDTNVAGRVINPDEYALVAEQLSQMEPEVRAEILRRGPNIRVNNDTQPWDHHWKKMWKHFKQQYPEAAPVA